MAARFPSQSFILTGRRIARVRTNCLRSNVSQQARVCVLVSNQMWGAQCERKLPSRCSLYVKSIPPTPKCILLRASFWPTELVKSEIDSPDNPPNTDELGMFESVTISAEG